jgi:hypothetical protein
VVLTLSLVNVVGTPGTMAATIEKAAVSEPTPITFLAWTLKLYVVPIVNPVLVYDVVVTLDAA